MTEDEQLKLIEQMEDDGLRFALSTPEGRAFLRWLLIQCGHRQNAFTTNALLTAHRTGMQQVGLELEARIMKIDSAGLVRILQEDYNVGRSNNGDQLDLYDAAE